MCRLNKSIYGLKQAPRAWFDRFTLHLLRMGFQCSRADSMLFILHSPRGIVIILLYVDDIVITASETSLLQAIIAHLSMEFAIKDLGILHYFLGIEVQYFPGGVSLSQSKYAHDILLRASMLEASSISTPLALKENSTRGDNEPVDATAYRSIVGALQYLTVTRIDITHAVNRVCQFMHSPTVAHLRQVKRILRYIKGTLNHGVRFLAQSPIPLTAICDAD